MIIEDELPRLKHSSRLKPPTLIVLHATAGASAKSSIVYLREKGKSYHYIIPRDAKDSKNSALADGTAPKIRRCVTNAERANHVGSTIPAPSGLGINTASIGISLANFQDPAEPYPSAQIEAMHELITHLLTEVPTLTHLTTHAVVQPWNRSDPRETDGPAVAARHGLIWWEPTAEQIAKHKPKKKKK